MKSRDSRALTKRDFLKATGALAALAGTGVGLTPIAAQEAPARTDQNGGKQEAISPAVLYQQSDISLPAAPAKLADGLGLEV